MTDSQAPPSDAVSPQWRRFWYSGFYDVPLGVVVPDGERVVVLVSEFDETVDDFGPYTVFEARGGQAKTLSQANCSWADVDLSQARVLGTVPATRDLFDPSLRQRIRLDLVEQRLHMSGA